MAARRRAIAAAVADRPIPRLLGDRPITTVQESKPGALNVAGTRREYKKPLGSPHWTPVFITINTNLKTRDEDLAVTQLRCLRDVTRQMLATKEILKILDVHEERPISFDPRTNLLSPINVRIAAEFGRAGSIHTHSRVLIHHTSKVWFNKMKIKAFIRDRMNAIGEQLTGAPWFKNRAVPNVKIQLLGNPDEAEWLEKYMDKDRPEHEELSPISVSF